MTNDIGKLEQRVTRLENELGKLKRTLSKSRGQPWWQRVAGRFEDDEAFAEIARLGQRIRRSEGKGSR